MNARCLKWLYQELPVLVNKGVMPQQQADAIKEYYSKANAAGKRKTVLIICSILGFLLIGLGVISLLAHNWDELGRPIRAFLSVMPLLAGILLTGWAMSRQKASPGLLEGTATFLTLMIGASIALVSQTYNISGELVDFVLTWMLLSVPLVYLCGVTIPAIIYVIGITSWVMGYIWGDTAVSFLYFPLILAIAPHCISIVKKKQFVLRVMLLSVILAFSITLVISLMLGRIFPELWIVFIPLCFSVVYLAGNTKFGDFPADWQRPFSSLGGLGVIISSFILTYRWPWEQSITNFYGAGERYHTAGLAVILALLIAAVFLSRLTLKQKRYDHFLLGIAWIIAIISYGVPVIAAVIANIYLIIIGISKIKKGLRVNNLRTMNSGLMLISLLIALRFFDSQISFLIKGLVLIALGLGLLVFNSMIMRRKGVNNE